MPCDLHSDRSVKPYWVMALLVIGAAAAAERLSLNELQQLKLIDVKSVYVDQLNGGEGRAQIRDMLIGSLQRMGLFILTEDEEQADAFLRGAAEDLVYYDHHLSREGLNVRGSASSSRREAGESDFGSSSFGIGDTEQTSRRERKHEATAAVRLVLRNGEVIWSTTQESSGGKYKGSAADVAEKVTKELQGAYEAATKRNRKESP